MEAKEAFRILHIEETKDPGSIKQAYYTQLKENNPEDDPEGFKRIRQAFETANAYCQEKEVVVCEHTKKNAATDLWIEEFKALYENPKKRIDSSNWETLLGQPICMDLEDGIVLRDKMLQYLMDHYRLDASVWKMIDRTFDINMAKKQLQERFPADFLNYITDQLHSDGTINYELFELNDDAELDQYFECYYDICNKIRNEAWDGLEDSFQKLMSYGVYHPYEDVERIKYFVHLQKQEEALLLAKHLEGLQYKEDNNIMAGIALANQCAGNDEAANALWIKILANEYYYPPVVLGRANYLFKKEEYLAAKKVLTDALNQWGEHEGAQELLSQVNQHVISYYVKELVVDPENEFNKLELAWSYFQEKMYSECFALLKQFEPSEKKAHSYYSLYARLYYNQEIFQKALPYLIKWNDIILHTPAEDSEEGKAIRSRLGISYYMLGVSYCQLGDNKKASCIL